MYKIFVKTPKTDNEKKIEGKIEYIFQGPRVYAKSELNNLPNPFINTFLNKTVDNSGKLTFETFFLDKSDKDYETKLANEVIKYFTSEIFALYNVTIELIYEKLIVTPVDLIEPNLSTGPEIIATQSNTITPTPTIVNPPNTREYLFDVQIENTFYNQEIGYLTITGKVDNTFIYGDEQDTIDPEYQEETFAGSEEDQLLLASIQQLYSPEELASFSAEEVEIIKENAKSAQKLGKPLKSPPNELIVAMRKYGITSKLERAHFLAQCAHESGNYVYKSELASGNAYNGRKDLGNTQAGDGPRFKGRGFIQITGRYNYTQYSKYLVSKGLDNVLNNPDLIATKYAADAACYWWKFLSRDIASISEKGATEAVVLAVTKRVNGKDRGLADRQQKFDKIWSDIQKDSSKYA